MNSSSFSFVQTTHAHLDGVYRVQCDSYPANLHEPVSLFQKLLECKGSICYVVLHEGQVQGYIFSYPSVSGRTDFENGCGEITGDETAIYIHDLCVSPSMRGNNFAGLLYEKVLADAKEQGYQELIAVSIDSALSFWEKKGFTASGEYDYHGSKAYNIRKLL